MVGALTGDEMTLGAQPASIPVLKGDLQRGLHGLGAAAAERDVAESVSAIGEDHSGELLQRLAGKEISIRAGDTLELLLNGCVDLAMRVTEAECRGASRAIQIASAGRIEEIAALAPYDPGKLLQSEADRSICR